MPEEEKKGGIEEMSKSENKDFYEEPQDVNRAYQDVVVGEPSLQIGQ